jgi:uncharacterized protein YgiM (DUF1202 family)
MDRILFIVYNDGMKLFISITAFFLVITVALVTAAQSPDCRAAMEALWTTASDACVKGPRGYICNGGSAPQAEPAGPVSTALGPIGALVETKVVQAMRTPRIDATANTTGIAWLRLEAPIEATALLIGDVTIRNVSPSGFPPWQSTVIQTSTEPPTCTGAPHNSYVVQSPLNQTTRLAINGISLVLDGTILARTTEAETIFVMISGQSNLIALGLEQTLLTGQQIHVSYMGGDFARPVGFTGAPRPFDPSLIQNLPVALFARPVIMPQPGYVRTEGAVNMRSSPSLDAGIIIQVQPGEVMSVLGQNGDATWYHVRMDTGETGWMLGELLQRNLGPITAVYEATPLPPQRYGELGRMGRVLAPAGVNMRVGPDVGFPSIATLNDGAMVTLLARSPYSPWLKVETSGITGWVALITLETQAFIDALPIDYNVPPPPAPTVVPGSFGNAFPDPNGGG